MIFENILSSSDTRTHVARLLYSSRANEAQQTTQSPGDNLCRVALRKRVRAAKSLISRTKNVQRYCRESSAVSDHALLSGAALLLGFRFFFTYLANLPGRTYASREQ
jgi:hypothetical protein